MQRKIFEPHWRKSSAIKGNAEVHMTSRIVRRSDDHGFRARFVHARQLNSAHSSHNRQARQAQKQTNAAKKNTRSLRGFDWLGNTCPFLLCVGSYSFVALCKSLSLAIYVAFSSGCFHNNRTKRMGSIQSCASKKETNSRTQRNGGVGHLDASYCTCSCSSMYDSSI